MIRCLVFFLLVSFMFSSCMRETPPPKMPMEQEAPLSLEEKAKNTFKNTTAVFSGSMLLAFSNSFRSEVDTFRVFFEQDLSESDIQELDQKIATMDANNLAAIDRMIVQIDSAINALSMGTRISLYQKMFMNDLIREGVAITEKYELPYGFRPLSHPLTNNEIKRYILKVTTHSQNMDDPVLKTYMELFAWFQEVGEDYKADPEIQEFLNSMRK